MVKEEPYIVVYKSKPIKGITLELLSINPNYKSEKECFLESLERFNKAIRESSISLDKFGEYDSGKFKIDRKGKYKW